MIFLGEQEICRISWHISSTILEMKRKDLAGILSCESGEIFMKYFKQYLNALFRKIYSGYEQGYTPEGFILNHLVGGFAEAVSWWVRRDIVTVLKDITGVFLRTQRILE